MPMQLPNENELKQFDRWGVERPSHEEHGEFTPEQLIPFEATRWWLEGDMLYAEGNHGIVANKIPTDYICTGIDDKALPILKKVAINKTSAADRGAK